MTLEQFTDVLEQYRHDVEAKAADDGVEAMKRRRRRRGDPMVWLVQHQVLGWTYEKVAAKQAADHEKEGKKPETGQELVGPDVKTVGRRVRQMAKLIGLTLRPAPGRPNRGP